MTVAPTVIAGPALVDPAEPALDMALAALWLAVTRADGAVGFTPDAPAAAIAAAAAAAVAEARRGDADLIVLRDKAELVGAVFLVPGASAVVAHRGTVVRLMVHPGLQGQGWGSRLLDAVVARGAARGLELLLLSVRGGTPLPDFYAARGWDEVGRWPGAVRVAPGDDRDEVWFARRP